MNSPPSADDPYRIATLDDLLTGYSEPGPTSLAKEVDRLTPEYRRWIEAAPFFALATSGPGGLDCTPRGDPAGSLFRVLDERTIAIPDRRGNNRLDSLRNLLTDPRIALLFLVPGILECVRINGRASLTRDPALIAATTFDGHAPVTVVVVQIESVYFQCARAIMRAGLWKPEAHRDPATLPTAGEMTRSASATFDQVAYDATLRSRQIDTLY